MPTIDTLEMMRRLCDDPFLSEEEAAEGVVLTEEAEEGFTQRCDSAQRLASLHNESHSNNLTSHP